jgi:hypothetical protein
LIAALAWAIATVATTLIPVSLSESIHNVINAVVCVTVYAVLFLLVGLRDVDKELISLLIERAKSYLR